MGLLVVVEVAKQGPHLGILGKIDEGRVAAGDEEAGIALDRIPAPPQESTLPTPSSPTTTALMRPISCGLPPKYWGSTEVLSATGRFPSWGHQGQGITGLQQGGGRHPQFILVCRWSGSYPFAAATSGSRSRAAPGSAFRAALACGGRQQQ